jgi:hypothetical protein
LADLVRYAVRHSMIEPIAPVLNRIGGSADGRAVKTRRSFTFRQRLGGTSWLSRSSRRPVKLSPVRHSVLSKGEATNHG